jgi:hypothetical protein
MGQKKSLPPGWEEQSKAAILRGWALRGGQGKSFRYWPLACAFPIIFPLKRQAERQKKYMKARMKAVKVEIKIEVREISSSKSGPCVTQRVWLNAAREDVKR